MPKLNPQQQAAVTWLESPLLVLAGAGSGKTRVITEKIAWMIEAGHHPPDKIAAITFTNKAAREMRERLSKRLGRGRLKGLTVSTFHALGWRIVAAESEACGRRRGVSILDDGACTDLVQELLPAAANAEVRSAVRRAIGGFKDAGLTPETALSHAEDENTARAAGLFGEYEKRMRRLNAVDFDDLIALPARLLEDPEARTRWRRRWRYFLIDEYQDTSHAQYRLLRALVGEAGYFTAVGDDDQSIYGWRGARPENLAELGRDFPRLKVVKLEQNYRSSGKILQAANAVIAVNPHTFDKKLWSDLGPGDHLRVTECADEQDEAETIVRDLTAGRFAGRVRYGDCAVLYRSNSQSRTIEKALRAHGIPYVLSGGPSWFDAREIRDSLAYLRLLANPDDNPAFLRVANVPRRALGSVTLGRVAEYAAERELSLFDAAVDPGLRSVLPAGRAEALRGFTDLLIRYSDQAVRGDPAEAFADLLDHIGYRGWLEDQSEDARQAERRVANLGDFLDWVRRLADKIDQRASPEPHASGTDTRLQELVARIALASGPADDEDDPGDQVRLMTLHAAKGLEFPRVYLAGCEEGLLPHHMSLEEDRLEEERRLMYVGITRAGRQLMLSYCRQRRRHGEHRDCEPSRFLSDLPEEIVEWPGATDHAPPSREQVQDRIAALRALVS